MPDPLMNDDFGDLQGRVESPTDAHSRLNLDRAIAYQAPLEDPIRKGELNPERELPESGSPQLNRTARQVGSAIGGVVSQARRLPQSARNGLYVVRDRAQEMGNHASDQITGSAASLAGNAQERIREFGDVAREAGERAQQRVGEMLDMAEVRARELLDKADELTGYLAARTNELKLDLDDRTRELRDAARIRAIELRDRAQRAVRERPLETLGCLAAAAFIVGVSLRIARSRNASH